MGTMTRCPCGSGELYSDCCQRFHKGQLPGTALELMKSRYAAYARALPDYIIRTTHPDNPHYRQDAIAWASEILLFCKNTEFRKLEIIDITGGSEEAFVTFRAHLRQNHQKSILFEKSRFQKVGAQWLYLSGTLSS